MVKFFNIVIQLQSHLAEAMKRMRSGANEANVDRELLANLVVGFISAPRGTSKPFEILSIISNILKFTEEEKERVGLIRSRVVNSPRTPESFTEVTKFQLEFYGNVDIFPSK